MKQKIYTTPAGVPMQGTVERLSGCDDTTDERLWPCEEGNEWRESQLSIVEVSE